MGSNHLRLKKWQNSENGILLEAYKNIAPEYKENYPQKYKLNHQKCNSFQGIWFHPCNFLETRSYHSDTGKLTAMDEAPLSLSPLWAILFSAYSSQTALLPCLHSSFYVWRHISCSHCLMDREGGRLSYVSWETQYLFYYVYVQKTHKHNLHCSTDRICSDLRSGFHALNKNLLIS